MATFRDRLCEALSIRGVTAADLARRLGVNEGTISNYKRGTYKPKQRRTEEIARALNVSIPYLLGADVDIGYYNSEKAIDLLRRPLVGSIACGAPILAEENIECMLSVPDGVDCDFMLRCRGDSMTGARIMDGDIVYIRQMPEVENGQIAAVRIGEEATLKRFYQNGETVTLMPDNPKYPPQIYIGSQLDEIQVLGLAVAFTSTIK